MNKAFSFTSAALMALAVAGCGPKAEKTADDAAATAGNAIDTGAAIAANTVDDIKAAVAPTPTGQEFINTAARSDAFEIAAAKLAATNAAAPDVKTFAAEMIKAHTASTAKIKAAASAASPALTPDPVLTGDQSEKLADLGKLKGAAFDEAYVDGQVDAHEDALSLMQGYAKDGEVATLKTAAGEIAPVVAKHLEMVRAMDK